MSVPLVTSSVGVSRNLTQVFKSFRHQEKKESRFQPLSESGKAGLLDGIPQSHLAPEPSSLKELPPVWVDTYDKVVEDLKLVEQNSKC